MTYAALALCCALLSYGAVNAVVSLVVALLWRSDARGEGSHAQVLPSPHYLFMIRMFPVAASTVFVAAFFLPGFLHLEPGDTTEIVSPLMLAIASVPGLLLAWGGLRGLLSWLATARLVRNWTSKAERLTLPATPAPAYCIDSDFPVVSLAGVLRPRLFLSRQVVSSCTPNELSAILAHEAAHHARLDNLKRLLMRSCPDFLSLTSMADSIELRWCEASEVDADERAAGSDLGARTDLAAALVKVVRLAAGRSFPYGIPASAFHRGGNIDRRVRRLVSGPVTTPEARRNVSFWAWMGVGMVLLISLASQPKVLQEIHQFTELVVDLLQ